MNEYRFHSISCSFEMYNLYEMMLGHFYYQLRWRFKHDFFSLGPFYDLGYMKLVRNSKERHERHKHTHTSLHHNLEARGR